MSKHSKSSHRTDLRRVEVKSKFDAEFRRISVLRDEANNFTEFYKLIEKIHNLNQIPFLINYTDPRDQDLLPINNDDNFRRAISTAKPMLRVIVQRKGEIPDINGYGTLTKKKNIVSKLIQGEVKPRHNVSISMPEDFRRVSAIIDVDIVPETQRRVKLMKNGSDKPLGFYIRDGTSMQVTAQGAQKVPGIFISRLMPGGLAESTGLLAVNDEVMEVNGIEVAGKTLDQVTDMMVANSSNLIITVKPVNQKNNLRPRGVISGQSQKSTLSLQSSVTAGSDEIRELDEDEDEVKEHFDELSKVTADHSTLDSKALLLTDQQTKPENTATTNTQKDGENNIITL